MPSTFWREVWDNEIYLAKIEELDLEIARKEQNLYPHNIDNVILSIKVEAIFYIINDFSLVIGDISEVSCVKTAYWKSLRFYLTDLF